MVTSLRVACLISFLPGCAIPVYSGTFTDARGEPWDGQRQRVGCVDVAVGKYSDDLVEGAAVRYQFGNRCDRAVLFSLNAVRATGRDANGDDFPLAVFDPDRAIRATVLEARDDSSVVLEYVPAHEQDADRRIAMVCLDLSAVTPVAAGSSRAISCLAPSAPAAKSNDAEPAEPLTHPEPDFRNAKVRVEGPSQEGPR